MKLIKTYKYKLKPNAAQVKTFEQWLGTCRYLYNVALEHRIIAYRSAKVSISRFDQYTQLVQCKQEAKLKWLADVHSEVLQETLDRVDKSYQNFFRGSGFPHWAKRDKYQSFTFKRSVSIQGNHVKLPKIGLVKFYNSRMFKGKIKYVTIVKELSSWYICCCVEQDQPICDESQAAGIDLGVQRLATLSDGTYFENPRFFQKYQKSLRLKQRKLARQKKGSKSREKTKWQLSKLHQKIRRCRNDYNHKVSYTITCSYNEVYMENLNLKGMTKSAKGTIDNPGRNVSQKTGLNRSLNDAGLYQLRQMIEYKTVHQGGVFSTVNPSYTSQTCSCCGHIAKENRPTQSIFQCVSCSFAENADVNAAKNILALGRSLSTQREAVACACA